MAAPPEETRDDTQAYLEYIQRQGGLAEELAEYLALLHADYYDGNMEDSDRYLRIEEHDGREVGLDISTLIDVAVMFGWVWEREDPYDPEEGNG